jgi:putative ABC transport system permease protein
MIRNYVKIAYRNLLRSKAFSSVNIWGLAIGMTACFFGDPELALAENSAVV